MNERAHIQTTKLAVKIANQVFGVRFTKNAGKLLAASSADTDHVRDVEFVRVKGQKDDPHQWEWFEQNDETHFISGGINLTAFNHYIDIKKGPGHFDDYDGYSYARGSAHTDQYQPAERLTRGAAYFAARFMNFKVDEGISYWLNDEYVHSCGRRWYRACSPALMQYSYPQDKGKYKSKKEELKARFPLAGETGQKGRGFPHSVFMPLDNLGRYWFDVFVKTNKKDLNDLGPVLHAIQDASIPHHAAGYAGNWHVEYEKKVDEYTQAAYSNQPFIRYVIALLKTWQQNTSPAVGKRMGLKEREKAPALQWPIQHLITWVALHAYHAYAEIYHHFQPGFQVKPESMKKLCALATAMSSLVLYKAVGS